ncbi:peptidylprolyl isomerase FKBP-type [Methanocaldococcus infernus ME]|uniref:Peptidyl-prolyl cis-trans isomerase n=1 Tax=Methanocaldococcus infernus (strain DSM 11812 / JCM 15783 / ME) TaxID=573063 RepID=D5VR14_METIM|nr:peptidylprolyl isomerase [Methanocaldococcus infernus]ADG13017.1 peptidylprolyl isomerase FKBP-type [Methanocaldococcus infernus ME]
MVEKGKMVKVSYDGYVDGKLFDTTDEEKAKKEGIYNENMVYGPVAIFVGAGQILPGLDEVLEEMGVGEEREVTLPPEKAFGQRRPDLLKIVPMSEFKKRGIKPIVGLPITIDGVTGRIVSVNSGRVLVDFNHPLAGKEVKYRIKIEEVVEDPVQIVKEIVKLSLPRIEPEVKIEGESVIIELPEFAPYIPDIQVKKMVIANEIIKRLGYKEVKFIETFKKKEEDNKDNGEE